ncbi:MAG: hypothetical protein PHQ00_06865 [Phycisphaerae bacterium]|nr:hypothetical protein [Phycisphaerae bacterium]
MKKILQESAFYYVLIPIVIAIWPLAIWQKYLPSADGKLNAEEKRFVDARNLMEQILQMDTSRLNLDDTKGGNKFDYTTAIDAAARKIGIPATGYSISSKPIRGSGRDKTQDCQIIINEVGIVKFAQFISNLQTTWANLSCEKVTLTKKRGLPDAWKTDLTLKYHY